MKIKIYKMQTSISNPKFNTREVGKFVKCSKMVFTWEFSIENAPYKVEFFHSRKSNKRRLNLNGNKVLETKDYSSQYRFNFIHKDRRFSVFQVSPVLYDLSINDIIFSRLLEGESPSPEASVKQDIRGTDVQDEEVKYQEDNNYPELPVENFNVFESIVCPTSNRQNVLDELFGESSEPIKLKASNIMIDSVSTAQTGNVLNSRIEGKSGVDEEVKECSAMMDMFGLSEAQVQPHRCHTSKTVNLMEFEPLAPKKKISDMLGEIDFFTQEMPKTMTKSEHFGVPQGGRNNDIDIFSNFGFGSYLK
jgi:hypothetical protein